MKVNMNNNYVNFGAIRVTTGSSEAGKKADEVCRRIFREINPGGITGSDYHAMFFRNRVDEAKASTMLSKANIPYAASELADIADTFTAQEWAKTGDPMVLNRWYINEYLPKQ